MTHHTLSGKIVDLIQNKIFSGVVEIDNGIISSIREESDVEDQYILPGFIDAHIHIESSMLVPSEFARLAVLHGTVATVSDPHEIANVLGMEGIRYMCENSKTVPFHFFFGAPSCVPATAFETAGATVTADQIRTLFQSDQLKYLSEMMNFPVVLHNDPVVMEKIAIAKSMNKPIDGHAPGLMGDAAKNYIDAGISTDHECFTLEEALNKVRHGMKIVIREGSAAKNYEALHPLIKQFPEMVMFCSDDKHPNELIHGHINDMVRRSVALGYDVMDVLKCSCLYPAKHYGLGVGLLQTGDPADCIVVNNLKDFKVKSTYIKGIKVASEGKSLIQSVPIKIVNHFNCSQKNVEDFAVSAKGTKINVIEAIPGELITKKLTLPANIQDGHYKSNPSEDILKLAVVNRYKDTKPSIGFIKGMGLKEGALASSVAHDSHNIVAVGVDDASLCKAVNAVIESKGGVAVVKESKTSLMALPIAGLMSDQEGWKVAKEYELIKDEARMLGSSLPDPFMTLSFLALLVIPSLKLSDKGLFDGDSFKFISLEE
ncbi:MAG: adenine deaminase [Waddliaceae bacterium]